MITLAITYALLGLTWTTGSVACFLAPWATKYKMITASLFTTALFCVGVYETENFETPLSKEYFTEEIRKLRTLVAPNGVSQEQTPTSDVQTVTAEFPPPSRPSAWVTQSEIDAQRNKTGRTLLNYSPEELLKIGMGPSNGIDAYRNKWVKLDYPFLILNKEPSNFLAPFSGHYIVTMNISNGQVIASFDESWEERLIALRPNNRVRAICRLQDIRMTFMFGPALNVDKCELL